MNPRQRTEIRQNQRLALSLGLAASIRVLRHDATGLTLYLEEQAAQNPCLRLERYEPSPGEWLPRWSQALNAVRGENVGPQSVTGPGPSLMSHVSGRIEYLFPPGRQRRAAQIIALALEPSGWLGRPLAELATEAGLSLPEAEAVLAQLQRIEPAGLFARSLAECLELQCREAGALDPTMALILTRLDLLASGETARLARLAGVTEAEILQCRRRIRALDPKPGAAFDHGSAPVREPDLMVTRGTDGWEVALNRSALPDVVIVPPPKGARDDAARANLDAARAVRRQVEARGHTLLRLATEIFHRQEQVIGNGLTVLRPMTMAEIADAAEVHESTVSRAVAGASVDTPAGTFWLRQMFTTSLRRDHGYESGAADAPSGGALRARLARFVAGEDPKHPLSDAALATALSEGGVAPARRTVAKYRCMLSIPAAHRRRQR